jgi:hypothetical protein
MGNIIDKNNYTVKEYQNNVVKEYLDKINFYKLRGNHDKLVVKFLKINNNLDLDFDNSPTMYDSHISLIKWDIYENVHLFQMNPTDTEIDSQKNQMTNTMNVTTHLFERPNYGDLIHIDEPFNSKIMRVVDVKFSNMTDDNLYFLTLETAPIKNYSKFETQLRVSNVYYYNEYKREFITLSDFIEVEDVYLDLYSAFRKIKELFNYNTSTYDIDGVSSKEVSERVKNIIDSGNYSMSYDLPYPFADTNTLQSKIPDIDIDEILTKLEKIML